VSPVLHPQHKLEYFRNAGWTEEWIDTARDLVRKTFDERYQDLGPLDDHDQEATQVLNYFFSTLLMFLMKYPDLQACQLHQHI
jgi:hypothetical protein